VATQSSGTLNVSLTPQQGERICQQVRIIWKYRNGIPGLPEAPSQAMSHNQARMTMLENTVANWFSQMAYLHQADEVISWAVNYNCPQDDHKATWLIDN
jgi:hypothetical protein